MSKVGIVGIRHKRLRSNCWCLTTWRKEWIAICTKKFLLNRFCLDLQHKDVCPGPNSRNVLAWVTRRYIQETTPLALNMA